MPDINIQVSSGTTFTTTATTGSWIISGPGYGPNEPFVVDFNELNYRFTWTVPLPLETIKLSWGMDKNKPKGLKKLWS